MIEIEKPKIETVMISEDSKFGKFIIEPLGAWIWKHFREFLAPHPSFLIARSCRDIYPDRRGSS